MAPSFERAAIAASLLFAAAASAAPPNSAGPATSRAPSPPAAPTGPSTSAASAAPTGPVLTLDQAVNAALEHQPALRQAKASSEAASARADEAFAPLLPQVNGTASYQRSTANFAPRPGAVPSQVSSLPQRSSFSTFDYFNLGLTVNQLVYDFGQTSNRYRVARSNADAQRESEDATRLSIVLAVKNAYFQARAQKALVQVARETLENQDKHLSQIEGFVEVGTRPRIDLVQARADRESAELSRVNAENSYQIAKAQLVQAMGVETSADFDVADESVPPVEGEDAPPAQLFERALANRPDVRAALDSIRAQELSVSAAKGAYGPTLGVSTGLTEAGTAIDALQWNWNAGATLSWPIFQGGLTRAQVAEAHANVTIAEAQAATLRQQVLLELEQARLGVRGAKQALSTAELLVTNTQERLHLAEGRYQTGAGSILELADAQLALTSALAQRVQSEYNLSTARAQLLKALGRQ